MSDRIRTPRVTERARALLFGAALLSIAAATRADEEPFLTVAESSEWQATAKYAEVVALCERLAAASERIVLAELGRSHEGRSLPVLIVSRDGVVDPAAAGADGRLVALLFGNIHAGEVCGKEALLMLARDIGLAAEHGLLERLVLAIVPILNADGNERVAPDNRPGQVGPSAGMGVRENAQSFDLNRDWVKLEAPETRALVRFTNRWDPALIIDTHTTNGSHHRYPLTYQGPKSPAGDPEIIRWVRDGMLPTVSARLREENGLETFFYGNFRDDHTRWETYPALARYGTPYRGIRNRIAILSEAYAYATYRERVEATYHFVRACLEHVAQRADEVSALLRRVDERTVASGANPAPGDLVPIRSEAVAFEEPVTVLGWVEEERDGKRSATDVPRDYRVELVNDFRPTESVRRPWAYLVPASLTTAIEKLAQHGIRLETLREDRVLEVERARITSLERSERAFQGRHPISVTTSTETVTARVSAGTVLVRTAQPLGSLAVYLLEARSEDGLVRWDLLESGLGVGAAYPILRLPRQESLRTALRAGTESASEAAEKRRITWDVLHGDGPRPDFDGSPAHGHRWLPDGEHWVETRDGIEMKVEARTGKASPLLDPAPVARALATVPALDVDTAAELARRAARGLSPTFDSVLVEHASDLYWARVDGSEARRLTSDPAEEELETFSPDGRFVAFVRDDDLWVVDVATGTERALTTGGSDTLRSGKADWVYFEEVFDRDWKTFWWSPDSRTIAFLRTDASMVPEFTIIDDAPYDQRIETARYPRVGQANPQVELLTVSVAGGAPRRVDLSAYAADDRLVTAVEWWPDGERLWLCVQNRDQTWLDVCSAPRAGGELRRLFRDETKAWVEIPAPPRFLGDGSFLITSERSGWRHVYRYSSEGELLGTLTDGEWEVRKIAAVDEAGGSLLVVAMVDSPIAENLYRVPLVGGEPRRLTPEPGSHAVNPAPAGGLFIDTFSSHTTPPRVLLRDRAGELVRVLDENPVEDLERFHFGIAEPFTIRCRDGRDIWASLLLPPDFDPQADRRYPVWFTTYGGPHAPTIRDTWGGGRTWDQMLAADGIVVFRCDPRSASADGARSTWSAYRQLGVQELRDIEDAIEFLKKAPWVDGDRIGMSGHSYGGFMTLFAMTRSKLFAGGIAGAPVTDWRLYDTIYTERYMGKPQDNPEGYESTSIVRAAGDLHGRLLLVHGNIDDNVHMQNSMSLVRALQEAGKDFELMIYPGSRHGIWAAHYTRLRYDFTRRVLGLEPAPETQRPSRRL